MKIKLLCLLLLISVIGHAQQNESDYYDPDLNATTSQTISNLTGVESGTDSNTLNAAITALSNSSSGGKSGGTLTVLPNGGITTFYLEEIDIKSNVHLKIDSNITIIPQTIGGRIFTAGVDSFVENVALTSTNEDSSNKNDAFKVTLREDVNENESVLRLGDVKNFKVSGMNIQDKKTKISCMTMSIGGPTIDKTNVPTDGVVKNLWGDDMHVGYGLIQAQSAKHVYFKNLHGTGGITLRFESGNNQHIQDSNTSVDQVYAENISVTDGDAALNLSPHRSNQGSVDAIGIKAYNSTWAVQAAAGFIGTEGSDPPFENNKGTYQSVNIVIEEIQGGFNAQIKSKDFKYFKKCNPTEWQRLKDAFTPQVKATEASVRGNSIAAGRITAMIDCTGGSSEGCYNVNITYPTPANTSGSFELNPIGYGPIAPDCSTLSLNEDANNKINIYPNPATDFIHLKGLRGHTIKIIGLHGHVITSSVIKSETGIINVSNLTSGLYLLSSESPSGNMSVQKLIIQ